MRKFARSSVQDIIKRACKVFLEDDSAPNSVDFVWKGHHIFAVFVWSVSKGDWYLSYFDVVYPHHRFVRYTVNEDYDLCFAWC